MRSTVHDSSTLRSIPPHETRRWLVASASVAGSMFALGEVLRRVDPEVDDVACDTTVSYLVTLPICSGTVQPDLPSCCWFA